MTHTIGELEVVISIGLEKTPTKRPSVGDFGEKLLFTFYRASAEEAKESKQRTIIDLRVGKPAHIPTSSAKYITITRSKSLKRQDFSKHQHN